MKFVQFFRLLCVAVATGAAIMLHAADMSKTLYTMFEGPETGFDPAKYADFGSDHVNAQIFEPLLGTDYLSRPQQLVGRTAALPEILDGGKTFIYHIRPGIYFADDPVFHGKKRELIAQDYVYSFQRIVDSNNRGAPWSFFFQGKIIGLDAKIEAAQRAGKFDYDAPVEGLKALDRYTLQIKLKHPDYTLPMITAALSTGAVAREVIEAYGEDVDAHPVGTGPYRLKSWERRSHIVLTANPNFRGIRYQPPPGANGVDWDFAKQFEGQTLPRIGNIDIRIIQVPQAAWVSFENGQLDELPRMGHNYVNMIAPNGVLAPQWAARGFQVTRIPIAETLFYQFNMDDPVVGGYALDKIALRRAIGMAYNQITEANIVRNGQAIPMQSPIPPGVSGYDPSMKNTLGLYDPARANALLDIFGYKIDPVSGYRTMPDGKPLTIHYLASTGLDGRDLDELMAKNFARIHIRLAMKPENFSDLVQDRMNGHYQLVFGAWTADYPDATNFLQLLYGPNAGSGNDTRFRNKDYDRLYEEVMVMPDSPRRTELIDQMSRIVAVQAPWFYGVNRIRSYLAQPWVTGYKQTPDDLPSWLYLDIDRAKHATGHTR